jgi:hypothetical protein
LLGVHDKKGLMMQFKSIPFQLSSTYYFLGKWLPHFRANKAALASSFTDSFEQWVKKLLVKPMYKVPSGPCHTWLTRNQTTKQSRLKQGETTSERQGNDSTRKQSLVSMGRFGETRGDARGGSEALRKVSFFVSFFLLFLSLSLFLSFFLSY